MPAAESNLNLRRRLFPGLLAVVAAVPLRAILPVFRRKRTPDAPLWIFASYMVGDLFMALPALKRLDSERSLRVVCRPDCAELLRREGLDALPFDNAFFVRKSLPAWLRTARAAWRLRALPVSEVLDLDADPRTALWMRLAGATRVVSFRRPFGALFDATFALPVTAIHQADKDAAVVAQYSGRSGRAARSGERGATPDNAIRDSEAGISRELAPASPLPAPRDEAFPEKPSQWLLSVWTRKSAKNWPLERWEEFLKRMEGRGVPFAILDAPDGDAVFKSFRSRWSARTEFVSGSLEQVLERVRVSAGVVATDNFLGHMAGYCGKPVLWINLCSPAAQVEPRGPRTVRVGPGNEVGLGQATPPSVDEAWSRFLELTA